MLITKEVVDRLQANKPLLFEKYPIRSLAIFGSYARNEQISASDVDVMVEFHDKIGLRFIDLAEELEVMVGEKIDLVSKNGIKDKYLQAIQSDLIYV
ncbi:MAG: nucleotidyltransferase family protein [Cyclobacteriaceae bacterium]